MIALKRLLLVLGVLAGLLGMHPLAGLPMAAAHPQAAVQSAHDDGAVLRTVDGPPSEAPAPCSGPGPCHLMAGAGPGCVPLPGGHAPGLVVPAGPRSVAGTVFRVPTVPASIRGPGAPSLVELCISRT